jgi:hypothetical protein
MSSAKRPRKTPGVWGVPFVHTLYIVRDRTEPVALLLYNVVAESSLAVTVVTASVKEDERGGQGHTSSSLLHQSAM